MTRTKRRTMRSARLFAAGAGLALAVALGACAAARARAGETAALAAEVGVLVVPASETSYYRFEEHAATEHARNGDETPLPFAPADPGRPLAAGCDLQGGAAAVAYERALAALDLVEGRVRWLPVEWSAPPRALAVAGGLAAALAGEELALWRLRDAELLWREDARPWLGRNGLARIEYALPLGTDEFLVVASKPAGFAAAPRLVACRVTRAAGDWQSASDQLVPELSSLHRCASDGRDVYLAGVHETSRPGRGAGPELAQSLVVVRLSPRASERAVLVRAELHRLETDVVDLTAGPGWVGLVARDGQTGAHALRLYRTADGLAARSVYDRTTDAPELATWLGPDLAVVWSARGASFVQVP